MNQQEMLLLKLGEVVLKGQNRKSFEDRLVTNVCRRLRRCGSFQIYVRQSTIYAEPLEGRCDIEAAYRAARQVFGVVSVARAVPCEKTVESIVETAKSYLAEEFARAKSFKVESKRADKHFHLNSIQVSQAVGGDLAEAFPSVPVDVHHPDLTVFVEIREKHAYVHGPAVPGAGGLPVGSGGQAMLLAPTEVLARQHAERRCLRAFFGSLFDAFLHTFSEAFLAFFFPHLLNYFAHFLNPLWILL